MDTKLECQFWNIWTAYKEYWLAFKMGLVMISVFLLSTCRFPFVGVIFFVSTQNLLNCRSQHFHSKSAKSRNKKCQYVHCRHISADILLYMHRVRVHAQLSMYIYLSGFGYSKLRNFCAKLTSNATLNSIGMICMISVSALRSHWSSRYRM